MIRIWRLRQGTVGRDLRHGGCCQAWQSASARYVDPGDLHLMSIAIDNSLLKIALPPFTIEVRMKDTGLVDY